MTAYRAAFSSGFTRVAARPGQMLTPTLFFIVIVVAVTALWRAAVDAHGGSLGGYTTTAMLWYIFGAEAAYNGVRNRVIEDVGNDIASGAVAIEALRPASVAFMRMSALLGDSVARLLFITLIGGVVMALLGGWPPSLPATLLFIPSSVVAAIANIGFQYLAGAGAFWFRDAKAGWFLYQKLIFLFGGMLIPIELLPGPIAPVARVLPFSAMAYAPGRLLSGHVDLQVMLLQLGWAAATVAGAAVLFAAGERRLQRLGA